VVNRKALERPAEQLAEPSASPPLLPFSIRGRLLRGVAWRLRGVARTRKLRSRADWEPAWAEADDEPTVTEHWRCVTYDLSPSRAAGNSLHLASGGTSE